MEEAGREENDKHIPQFTAPRRRKYEEEEEKNPKYEKKIQIVLVGKTGNGKSSIGNSILGYQGFKSKRSPSSVTKEGNLAQMMWDDKIVIEVVDTPGFFDTHMSEDKVALEIIQSFGMIAPGPHIILYVLSCNEKCTKEEEKTLNDFHEIFTGVVHKFMILCFTSKDCLEEKTEEEFKRESPDWVKDFIVKIEDRTFFMNNHLKDNENQWNELYKIIEQMLKKNNNEQYSNDILNLVTDELKLKLEEKDKDLPFRSRQWAIIKRSIAYKGSYFEYLKTVFSGGGIGAAVGGIAGMFFGNTTVGVVLGGGGSVVLSGVAKAMIRMKHKRNNNRCVLS